MIFFKKTLHICKTHCQTVSMYLHTYSYFVCFYIYTDFGLASRLTLKELEVGFYQGHGTFSQRSHFIVFFQWLTYQASWNSTLPLETVTTVKHRGSCAYRHPWLVCPRSALRDTRVRGCVCMITRLVGGFHCSPYVCASCNMQISSCYLKRASQIQRWLSWVFFKWSWEF